MWAHIINTFLGAWLMAAPAIFHHLGQPAEFNDRIVGPLVATFSCVAIWECTRAVRWVAFVGGLWLLPSAFFMGYGTMGMVNALLCGVAIAALALVKGKLTTPFGGGWMILWKRNPYGVE
jgi:hypothetical protein